MNVQSCCSYLFISTFCFFEVLFVIAAVASLSPKWWFPDAVFVLLVNYFILLKQTPAQPLIRGNLYSRDTCFCPEGVPWIEVSLYLFYLLLQVYFFIFTAHLITFCAWHREPVSFLDQYYYDNLWYLSFKLHFLYTLRVEIHTK